MTSTWPATDEEQFCSFKISKIYRYSLQNRHILADFKKKNHGSVTQIYQKDPHVKCHTTGNFRGMERRKNPSLIVPADSGCSRSPGETPDIRQEEIMTPEKTTAISQDFARCTGRRSTLNDKQLRGMKKKRLAVFTGKHLQAVLQPRDHRPGPVKFPWKKLVPDPSAGDAG